MGALSRGMGRGAVGPGGQPGPGRVSHLPRQLPAAEGGTPRPRDWSGPLVRGHSARALRTPAFSVSPEPSDGRQPAANGLGSWRSRSPLGSDRQLGAQRPLCSDQKPPGGPVTAAPPFLLLPCPSLAAVSEVTGHLSLPDMSPSTMPLGSIYPCGRKRRDCFFVAK